MIFFLCISLKTTKNKYINGDFLFIIMKQLCPALVLPSMGQLPLTDESVICHVPFKNAEWAVFHRTSPADDHMGRPSLSINVLYSLVYRLTERINYLLYSIFLPFWPRGLSSRRRNAGLSTAAHYFAVYLRHCWELLDSPMPHGNTRKWPPWPAIMSSQDTLCCNILLMQSQQFGPAASHPKVFH